MRRQQHPDPAFVDLVYEHQGILRRICSVYASSREDREDLHQEILMQSWRSFPSFNGRSEFSTWLYRVALNTALLHRRREAAKRDVAPKTGAGASVDIAMDDRSEHESEVALLQQCIQELPALNRAIILLHLERRSYAEIAEITGLSRANVSVRLVRIKDELRQLLLAKGHQEG
jgi:RNA polymerase sigma-70 factor (ECF subfamily)